MAELYPLTGYHFLLEIDGITQAFFRECSGLSSEQQVIEYKEANKEGKTIIKKVPGTLKWSDITLKRGITDIMELWVWRKKIEDGKHLEARKNGSIVLFNQDLSKWSNMGTGSGQTELHVRYRFQTNRPDDVVKVSYTTKEILAMNLGIIEYTRRRREALPYEISQRVVIRNLKR